MKKETSSKKSPLQNPTLTFPSFQSPVVVEHVSHPSKFLACKNFVPRAPDPSLVETKCQNVAARKHSTSIGFQELKSQKSDGRSPVLFPERYRGKVCERSSNGTLIDGNCESKCPLINKKFHRGPRLGKTHRIPSFVKQNLHDRGKRETCVFFFLEKRTVQFQFFQSYETIKSISMRVIFLET